MFTAPIANIQIEQGSLSSMDLVEVAQALETLVAADLNSHRANDGTTALLAAANELRRRGNPAATDEAIAQCVANGMSLREAGRWFSVGVGRVRGALARSNP